jgi:hypothetical protein
MDICLPGTPGAPRESWRIALRRRPTSPDAPGRPARSQRVSPLPATWRRSGPAMRPLMRNLCAAIGIRWMRCAARCGRTVFPSPPESQTDPKATGSCAFLPVVAVVEQNLCHRPESTRVSLPARPAGVLSGGRTDSQRSHVALGTALWLTGGCRRCSSAWSRNPDEPKSRRIPRFLDRRCLGAIRIAQGRRLSRTVHRNAPELIRLW